MDASHSRETSGGATHAAHTLHTDVIVVGAGLTGPVAADEASDAGRSVLPIDQEGERSLGAQAH